MTPITTLAVLAVIAITGLILTYAGLCVIQPYRACPRCRGTGERRRARECTRCQGTRKRLRLGRRAWNYIQHTRGGQ